MEAIRNGYELLGVDNYYKIHQLDYKNPHEEIIDILLNYAKENWNLGNSLLDLCCGSGEVSRIFKDENIEGIDPYTYLLYKKSTDNNCYKLSFKDIVINGLPKQYDTVICSFAMHLCDKSMLPMLLYRIGESTDKLLIVSPHKRPDCNGIYNWKISQQLKFNKVNMILYTK